MQNNDGYGGLHDQLGAAEHPHFVSLSWNASDPDDECSGAATLQKQRKQYEKNGGAGLLKQSHRVRSVSLNLAAHNIVAVNAPHSIARIHNQGCVPRDPFVVIIRMVRHDQHTVIFVYIVHRGAFHL